MKRTIAIVLGLVVVTAVFGIVLTRRLVNTAHPQSATTGAAAASSLADARAVARRYQGHADRFGSFRCQGGAGEFLGHVVRAVSRGDPRAR